MIPGGEGSEIQPQPQESDVVIHFLHGVGCASARAACVRGCTRLDRREPRGVKETSPPSSGGHLAVQALCVCSAVTGLPGTFERAVLGSSPARLPWHSRLSPGTSGSPVPDSAVGAGHPAPSHSGGFHCTSA